MQLPLSIGILSWGQHNTLLHTLESYRQYGLLSKASQRFIFFQEATAEDYAIAEKYNLTPYGADVNLGIAGGYRSMLSKVEQPVYMFLENDWAILEPPEPTLDMQLYDAYRMISSGVADVARFRHRTNPGNPLWSRQFSGNELRSPEHLLDCVHWREHPEKDFPENISLDANGWFKTTSQYANWTNNPHMIRTDWANNYLVPHLGNRDIELDLQEWWRGQSFRVIQNNGLFTHWRIG